jgi:hypothetical protein
MPGGAYLELVPGVVHLDEPAAVRDAMLAGGRGSSRAGSCRRARSRGG